MGLREGPTQAAACYALSEGKKVGDALIGKMDGDPMAVIANRFNPGLESANIADFTWHHLRHTATSR